MNIIGNTEETTNETARHNTFLSNEVNKFLEDNIEYEKSRVRRRIEEFAEDRPVAKAIFQSIKNSFKI